MRSFVPQVVLTSSILRGFLASLVLFVGLLLTPIVTPWMGTDAAYWDCTQSGYQPSAPSGSSGYVYGSGVVSCASVDDRSVFVQLKEDLSWQPDDVLAEDNVSGTGDYYYGTPSEFMVLDPDGDTQGYFSKALMCGPLGGEIQCESDDSSRLWTHYEH